MNEKGAMSGARSKVTNERSTGRVKKENICKTKSSKKIMTPAPTKSSKLREKLALNKQMDAMSLVPNEVLHCVFKYLTISDLLRCCCVSKMWKEVAEISDLWELQFAKFPKQFHRLFSKAKISGWKNWKQKCIFGAKQWRRHHRFKKSLENSSTKFLNIRWLLVFQDLASNFHECETREEFSFRLGMSVRWSEVDIPPLSSMATVKLYALLPLFYDGNDKPKDDSICTRALLMKHSFKDCKFSGMKKLCGDQHVSIYPLPKYLYFGLWNSSLSEGAIAFIGITTPVYHLLDSALYGTSERICDIPKHKVFLDDIDPKYGMHGYHCQLELRNCRKSFFYGIFNGYHEGEWVDDFLCVELRRRSDFSPYYDISENISFNWKTSAIKGSIEDVLIVDMNLFDSNKHPIWNFSSVINAKKMTADQVHNYSFEDGEVWTLRKEGDFGSCTVELLKSTSSDDSRVLMIEFQLVKSFVNQWFGTSY